MTHLSSKSPAVAKISEAYREQQQLLHQNPHYGVASLAFAPLVASIMQREKITEISDYGAGKQNLRLGLEKKGIALTGYKPYDPAFPSYGDPQPAPLVCCIDVLEHVEPSCLTEVMNDLARITVKLGFFTIHTGPAGKTLGDGRNAHLIQAPSSWWLPKLSEHFDVLQLQSHRLMGQGMWMLVRPKRAPLWLDPS
jgi:hypothetical protein